MDRFKVMTLQEAQEKGWYQLSRWDEDYTSGLFDCKTDPPTLVATDGMEPENVTFYRDLAWIPNLLNDVANGN